MTLRRIDCDRTVYTNCISTTIEINRVELLALLNSRAENNFISQKTVVKLSIKGEALNIFRKAVNRCRITLYRQHNLKIKVENSDKQTKVLNYKFLATDIEEFNLILGME